MKVKSWRDMFEQEFPEDELIINSLYEEEWNRKFDYGFGRPKGTPFVAWSEKYVYFSCSYDGAEWIERMPRDPLSDINFKPFHVGGF